MANLPLFSSNFVTFDTFSGGGDDVIIGPGLDDSEDDNRTNTFNIWDTL